MKTDDQERIEAERRRRATDKMIGARLKKARQLAKMTGTQAGELTGYSKAQIGHFEAGRNPIKAADVGTLAEAYGQSCEWLILGRGRNGLTLEAERLVALFAGLPEEEQTAVLEFTEDRLRRARSGSLPRKSAA